MEMSMPIYTLKEIPMEAVTFAAPLALSGPLPGLFQQSAAPGEGAPLVLPSGGQLLAVSAPAHSAGAASAHSRTLAQLAVSSGTLTPLTVNSGTLTPLTVSSGILAPPTVSSGVGTLTPRTVSPGTLTPLTVSSETLTPLAARSGTLTPLTVSSGTLTPLTVGSGTLTPPTVSSETLTPLAASSGTLTPLTVSSGTLTPLTVGSGTLTPLTVSSGTLTPLTVRTVRTLTPLVASSGTLTPLTVSSGTLTPLAVSSAALSPVAVSSAELAAVAVSSAPSTLLPVNRADPFLPGPDPTRSSQPLPSSTPPSTSSSVLLCPPEPPPPCAPDPAVATAGAAAERQHKTEQTEAAAQPDDPADPAQGEEDAQEWAPRRKRARIDLTIEQKRQICLYHNENPTATAKRMVDFFHRQWGVVVGRSTIASTIVNKTKWLSMSEQKAKSKRSRAGKHERMEQRLYSWYMERRATGAYVSRERLFARAKEIGRDVGIPDSFSYSKGWLQKFQTRYNFRVTSQKSKTDAASKRFMLSRRKQLDRDLESTAPADIFCFGESWLCYQLLPRRSLAAAAEALRRHNSAVLVCLCTNMTGCRRLPPLVVGRSVTCGFSSRFLVDKLLQYRYSARGALTDAIFSEWLYRVDEAMRREQRNIVLLVGATSCNVERTYKLSNVKLRFLSTIGARSPFEEGIRAAFKIAYRRLQVQHLLAEARGQAETAAPDLRDAMYMIRESWRQVSEAVVAGSWLAAGLVPAGRPTEAGGEGERSQQTLPVPAGPQVQTYYYTAPQQPPGPLPPPPPQLQQPQHQQHEQHQPPHPDHPHHQQHYQPPLQPQQQQQDQQQQFFHGLQQLPPVGGYDAGLGQHFLSPFGLPPGGGGGYLLPDQPAELPAPSSPRPDPPPAAPPPPSLPDAGELNLAALRLLGDELGRLAVPADDLVTAEWLLAADDLLKPEPPDPGGGEEGASFVRPPEHVTQSAARWAADLLLAYLEQRDADLTPIDQLLAIRRRWLLGRGKPEADDQQEPPSGTC